MNRHERRRAKATTGWIPLEQYRFVSSKEQREKMYRDTKAAFPEMEDGKIRASIDAATDELGDYWRNDVYAVHRIVWAGRGPDGCDIVQLSIKRHDRAPAKDWRDFQRIKNQLTHPECEGMELYPAESRLVDTSTQFHIWVVADPKYRWPVGYNEGRVITEKNIGSAVQRPREEVDKQYD